MGFVLLIPLAHLVGGICLFELVAKPSEVMQTDESEGFGPIAAEDCGVVVAGGFNFDCERLQSPSFQRWVHEGQQFVDVVSVSDQANQPK